MSTPFSGSKNTRYLNIEATYYVGLLSTDYMEVFPQNWLVAFDRQHNKNKNKTIELFMLDLFHTCYMFQSKFWNHHQAVSSNTSLVIELC